MCIYPFIYIVSVSISSGTAVNRGEVWLYPVDMNFEAMKTVLRHKQLWISFANTFYYTIVGTFLNIVFTCLAAYPPGEVFPQAQAELPSCLTMYFQGLINLHSSNRSGPLQLAFGYGSSGSDQCLQCHDLQIGL